MASTVEQREFQAETRQLLDLMIHSIYSNKDTFLRELVSNSSDALDKLRLASYADKDLVVDTSDLHIELIPDAAARTLTVRDNGIGMSREEVIDLIGTLAKSGTAALRAELATEKSADQKADLIGQFGIGFYSTFMVADKVTLITRKAGEAVGTQWESQAEATYTIGDSDDAPQGTSVILHLKDADPDNHLFDYADPAKLKSIVKLYSDFISWPVRMDVVRTTAGEEGADDVVTVESEQLNSQKALWAKSSDEVTQDEYTEFYKHIAHAWDEPLVTIPMKAEGTFEYQALLFIPSIAPFDLYRRESKSGLQLYVKRVFIMGDSEDLLPEYLRFISGVVDAQDLSLNVSREILQQDRQIKAIRRRLTKKVLQTIKELKANDAAKYTTLWSQFGRALKEGLLSDDDNKELLLEISSFETTHEGTELTDLDGYLSRMGESQETIYFIAGENRQLVEGSPHIEAFKAKGIEVLILTDPVDEVWSGVIPEYQGKQFQSIAKGEVDLDDSAEKTAEREQQDKDFAPVVEWLGTVLTDDVKDVRISSRLTDSPVCLVGETYDMSPALAKMYKASGQFMPDAKRTLEINPNHALIDGLRNALAARPDDESLTETAQLLYGIAQLAEGTELDDPAKFTKTLAAHLIKSV